MKITPSFFTDNSTTFSESIIESSQVSKQPKGAQAQVSDIYDLDLDIYACANGPKTPEQNQLITSKSLCTPGCGNTGTGNSFCC